MKLLNNIWLLRATGLLTLIPLLLLLTLLPFVVNHHYAEGTQSAKYFFFFYACIAILPVWALHQFFKNSSRCSVHPVDILLLFFTLWVSFNKFILQEEMALSLRYVAFIGLVILYFVIRAFGSRAHLLLLVAICVGGAMQAAYGVLQLWDNMPSNHHLFKMTGGFFNPGPFAGYLAAIMPLAFGLYLCISGKEEKEAMGKLKQITGRLFRPLNRNRHIDRPERNEKWFSGLQGKRVVLILRYTLPLAIKYTALIAFLLIIIALPAARSRAAWLGAAVGTVYLLWHFYKPQLKQRMRQVSQLAIKIIGATILMILLFISLALYQYKKDSANGRMLIWKVTTGIIRKNPLTGVGQGLIPVHYMAQQATYFRTNPESPYAQLAGDYEYAFNEPLRICAENGLPALLPILAIALLLFRPYTTPNLKPINLKPINLKPINLKPANLQPSNLKPSNLKPFNLKPFNQPFNQKPSPPQSSTLPALLSISIFSLFSYPAEIVPIMLVSIVILAITVNMLANKAGAALPVKNIQLTQWPIFNQWQPLMLKVLRPTLVIVACTLLFWLVPLTTRYAQSWKAWANASHLYNFGMYKQSIESFEHAVINMQKNGQYLLHYGKALSVYGQHIEAVEILERAKRTWANSITCTALGDSYQALGQYALAAQHYHLAHDALPTRLYPGYLLSRHYMAAGDTLQANRYALATLALEAKVPSVAVKEIKDKLQEQIQQTNKGGKP